MCEAGRAFRGERPPRLAALRDECRVGPEEQRSFEVVIRAWMEAGLSDAEGG